MGAKTLTISMSEEDFKYLQEDGLLSASKIFQVALHNIKTNREQDVNMIKRLQNQNKVLQEKLFEAQEKINES